MYFIIIILLLLVLSIAFLQHPKFGGNPVKSPLSILEKSPNYHKGVFQNEEYTPLQTEGHSMVKITYDFLFKKFPDTAPSQAIPSVKSDLLALPVQDDVLVWFGHSSYFIQLKGKRYLIDPVFSGNASPIPGSTKSFAGTNVYQVAHMPDIDYLLISHDHYDHLDYQTILQLRPKVRQVICGLGVGAHLLRWKYNASQIIEKDWNEQIVIDENTKIYTATARHFSGRSFKRNNTLWLSYILQAGEYKIYLGGDSGYGPHFKQIGQKYGGFDLAILENGQYNEAWHEIHMMPHEVLWAAKDLNARQILPVHSSKFKLAFHPWYEPLDRLAKQNEASEKLAILSPKIGEIVYLNAREQRFEAWWKSIM